MYDFALKMVGDADTAGDITQEVFIRLYKSNSNHTAISNVKNWLFILTRNLCLNRIRDSRRQVSLDAVPETEIQVDCSADSRHIILQKAMYALAPDLREALILKEYQGFSYIEIGGILGITVPAVRSLLYRARVALKEIYEKYSIKG